MSANSPVEDESQRCASFEEGSCTSCTLLPLPYKEQLALKRQRLENIFSESPWHGLIRSVEPVSRAFGSRNKAKLAVSGYAHAPVIGLLTEDFRSVPLPDCPLHHPVINEVARAALDLIRQCGLPPYDIQRQRGELKYLIIRHTNTGETSVRLVLRSKERMERATKFALALQQGFPGVKVVSVNIQPLHAAILEGPEEIVLSAEKFIREKLQGRQLALAPQSFSQVTSEMAGKLYEHVASLVQGAKPQKLLDLFCGAGGFSVFAAPFCGQVTGVEITREAIEAAKTAVALNGLSNVTFAAGDADAFLSLEKAPFPGTVIVNPPRRGISSVTIESLKRLAPAQIIYSSCNPETLKRDLLALKDRYELLSLKPFDMFPLTEHVEVVAELRAKNH